MGSRVVRPDTVTLHISRGDWLLVKRELNAGEAREAFARRYVQGADGLWHADPLNNGMAQVTAYLVDWSLTDLDDKPLTIAGKSIKAVEAALNALDVNSFAEIRQAIQAHEDAVTAEREAPKNAQAGETGSAAISPSPSAAVGASSGSVN